MSILETMERRAEEFVDALCGGPRADRPGDRRPRRDRPRRIDVPVRRRALPAGRRAGPGQDPAGPHAGQDARPGFLPHPVHARPDAGRHPRHQHGDGDRRRQALLRVPARADLHADLPGRRNQPGHAQNAVGHAGNHAGRDGHRGRQAVSAEAAVLRHGHAKPHRAGRHVPAARGPVGPLLLQAAGGLFRSQGTGGDHRPDHAEREPSSRPR